MIADLRLQHFRSYTDSAFEFSPGVNIVVGPNASGKTNLLEAVLMVARGSSYRVRDYELVQFGEPWARLDAVLADNTSRVIKLVNEPVPSKTYEIADKPSKRLTMQHTLPVVLFEPNHLQLLSGSPQQRREYLDDLLEQTKPGYGVLRRQYRRVLAQRNSLLKKASKSPIDTMQLFPWNVRLSQLAGQIVAARAELSQQIQNRLTDLYKELSQTKTDVSITYESRWKVAHYETHMLQKLEADTELDHLRGFTGSGPHREDFTVCFAGRPAHETASRGEVRTTILALKIIELELLEVTRAQTPLLLLDDVFSELDGKRRRALTDYLQKHQTFITTTDADVVVKHFTEKAKILPLG